jgi:parallel beta-helix repeat protein
MDFEFSFYNVICNNQIFNNRENGIELSYSEQNKIFNNIFKNNGFFDEQGSGVYFFISSDNIVEDNIFKGNRMGIMLVYDSSNNSIKYNNFLHNIRSIVIYGPSNNSIKYNNFLHNIRSATFYLSNNNTWDYNYWNRPRLLPKLIIGYNEGEYSMILQINTDWHPARKPYNIPGIR